jgi:hypothetical protein
LSVRPERSPRTLPEHLCRGCKSGIKPFAATSDWKNPSFENTGVPKPHIRIDFALAFEQFFAPGHWKCLRLPKG